LSDATQEDFQWVAREIVSEDGEATLCRVEFVEGLRDDQIEALFHAARDADYAQVAEDARELTSGLPPRLARDDEEALASLGRRLQRGEKAAEQAAEVSPESYQGRTWVTRKNVHVDRMACVWLVRRFIDPDAKFKFVASQGYRTAQGEVTFDMYEADFKHVGDQCSFETLVERFHLREAGLKPLAEIVHDVDVKDGKFARPESPGVAAIVAGIALAEREDEPRIALGSRMFDALLQLWTSSSISPCT
jgi:hypothetical protein